MAKLGFAQLKVQHIKKEMDRGRGVGTIYSYPVQLEPPFYEKFSHHIEPPRRGLFRLFRKTAHPERMPEIPAPDNLGFIGILPAKEERLNLQGFERFLLSLKFDYPLSFEIIGSPQKISIQLAVKQTDLSLITTIIQSQFPGIEAYEQPDSLYNAIDNIQPLISAYGLKESHFFSLTANFRLDPYAALLSNLNSINNGMIALQILFQPVIANWAKNMNLACRDEFDATKSVFSDLPILPKLVSQKINKPLLAVSIRIIASNQMLLRQAESFLNQYGNEYNSLVRLSGNYPISSALKRTNHQPGILMSSEELAGLIHLPDSEIAIRKLEKAKKSTPPPQSTDNNGISLGTCHYQGEALPVAISFEWLSRHASIFGGTGAGKTNLLSYLFSQLIENSGVGFIDPNGDACLEFLSLIPKDKIDKVIYFDPINYPLSINPLYINDPSQIELTTVNLLTAIKRLFDQSSWGPRLEYILRKAIKTLILSENKTLLDVPLILTDKNYRAQVLTNITDPDLLSFWKNTFTKLPSNAMFSILNKLSILLDSDVIKPILSNPTPDIDFNDILNNQKIFIANLSKGTLGMNAHVLDSFLLSAFQMATMARAKIAKPQRKFFTLIIDEFHNYADSSNVTSINSLLSEARKYRVALITATQFLTQIDKRIRDAVFGNVGTLVSMRVGIDDAHILQKELGQFTDEDLLNLRVGEAIVRMGMAKDSFNLQVPLVEQSVNDHTQEILELAKRKKATTISTPTPANQPVSSTESPPAQSNTPFIPDTQTGQTNFSQEESDLLEFIYRKDEPLPFTRLAKEFNISTRQLYKLISKLSKSNYVAETNLSLASTGRKAKVVFITSDGIAALGCPAPNGKGGAAHQYYQQLIKTYAEKQGYTAQIEKHIGNQKTVDVSLKKDTLKTAVEISITTDADDELPNIQKCLSAGYDRIVVLCSDQSTKQNLEKLVNQNLQPTERAKLFISPLSSLFQSLFRHS